MLNGSAMRRLQQFVPNVSFKKYTQNLKMSQNRVLELLLPGGKKDTIKSQSNITLMWTDEIPQAEQACDHDYSMEASMAMLTSSCLQKKKRRDRDL